jgi:hypothetical protein
MLSPAAVFQQEFKRFMYVDQTGRSHLVLQNEVH